MARGLVSAVVTLGLVLTAVPVDGAIIDDEPVYDDGWRAWDGERNFVLNEERTLLTNNLDMETCKDRSLCRDHRGLSLWDYDISEQMDKVDTWMRTSDDDLAGHPYEMRLDVHSFTGATASITRLVVCLYGPASELFTCSAPQQTVVMENISLETDYVRVILVNPPLKTQYQIQIRAKAL